MNQPRLFHQSPPLSVATIPARPPYLLIVDDDRIMLTMLMHMLTEYGYEVKTARSGEEALVFLAEDASFDAVILDREMPGMSGLEVVAKMKSHSLMTHIPIIMLTGSGQPEQIQQGIDAGVFYYLVKPVTDTLLQSVASSAVQERRKKQALITELVRHDTALAAMRSCQLSVRTLQEAEDSACFLASCFPQPDRVVDGLLELLVNAVEHGNLGIRYEDKTVLLAENRWYDEIAQRLTMEENAGKFVDIIYQKKNDGWFVQITDQGQGFDWRRYWQVDPARATASHGRGIARARLMAFDRLAYNEAGNQVTVMVKAGGKEQFSW